jgi:hypothetical protein
MKKILLFIGILLVITIFIATYYSNNLFAISGCCVERSSYSGEWSRNGKDFESCRQLNDERDRDNVFDATGYVWWNVSCR